MGLAKINVKLFICYFRNHQLEFGMTTDQWPNLRNTQQPWFRMMPCLR